MNAIDFLFKNISEALNLKTTTAINLARLNIKTPKDLLFYKPVNCIFRAINPPRSKIVSGDKVVLNVTIDSLQNNKILKITCTSLNSGKINLLYFNKLPKFLVSRLTIGSCHKVSGIVNILDGEISISHPEFIYGKIIDNNIEPVYSLTYGVTSSQLFSYVQKIIIMLEQMDGLGFLDFFLTEEDKFSSWLNSIKSIHYITGAVNSDLLKKSIRRMAYDELLAHQIMIKILRSKNHLSIKNAVTSNHDLQKNILSHLNMQLTNGQKQVIEDIENDQNSDKVMCRMLQGDVGSGKTLVALLTIANYLGKAQIAIMAPTEILANQHYLFFKKALSFTNFKIALLTGKIKKRSSILDKLKNKEIDILIGTHAIFQEEVEYADLRYVIIDEQHRFGVKQRADLITKGEQVDLLIMSATPIPRSLLLTFFGDMDISFLKEKPSNRLEIITSVMQISKLDELIVNISRKIEQGDKIYWVCPLIEKNEELVDSKADLPKQNLMDAMSRFHFLEEIFPAQVAIMHGKSTNKEEIMHDFKMGSKKILVSTTVIEVGIDVPEATVIVIENAQRFGLSTLHQLRGRVGRGAKQSYCILLYNFPVSLVARERLQILKNSSDGFLIAEKDLELRGGGEILGVRQSGEQNFIFAEFPRDNDLLTKADIFAEKFANNCSNKFFSSFLKLYGYELSQLEKMN